MLISDLNKQRQAVGASTVLPRGQVAPAVVSLNPVGVTYDPNTRTISGGNSSQLAANSGANRVGTYTPSTNQNPNNPNVALQNATHQAALYNAPQTGQTYLDSSGKDTRSFDAQGNPIQGTGTLSPYAGNTAYDFYSAAPADQKATDAYNTAYNQGKAKADANYNNLVAQGFGDSAGAQYQQEMQQVTQAAQAAKDAILAAAKQQIQTAEDSAKRQMSVAQGSGQTGSTTTTGDAMNAPFDRQAFIQQKRAEGLTDAQIRQQLKAMPKQAAAPVQAPVQAQAPAPTTTPTPTTPQETPQAPQTSQAQQTQPQTPQANPSMVKGNVIRQLAGTETDPFMKIALGAYADQLDALGTQTNPMGYAAFSTGADANALSRPYDAVQTILDQASQAAKNNEQATKAFLKGQIDRTNTFNAAQAANIQAQLAFQRDQAVREQADANRKRLDSETIKLALQGGFGSSDGNSEIANARMKGEQAIQDLTMQYGFKMADVSLQFTQMTNEASDSYQTKWLAATDGLQEKLSNIQLQGISNQSAKSNAIKDAYKSYMSDIKQARIDHAKLIEDATKMVKDAHAQEQEQQYRKEQNAYQRIQWAVQTYGSNVPDSYIQSLSKDLPGVDVQGLMNTATLAERNGKKTGSGGGGGGSALSFTASQLSSDGKPLTMEEFVAQKQAEFNKSQAGPLAPITAAEKKKWQDEYNAKLIQYNINSPLQIRNDFNDKVKNMNLTGPQLKNKKGPLEDLIQQGNYSEARRYVDGIGKTLNPTQTDSYTLSKTVRGQLSQIQTLLDNLKGRTGPVIGQFVSRNPYDPDVVKLNAAINGVVSGLARGIFKERGSFTDADAQRFKDTLVSPTMTYDIANSVLNQTRGTVEDSITNSIQLERAAGYNVRDIYDIMSQDQSQGTADVIQPSQIDSDYVKSLNLK